MEAYWEPVETTEDWLGVLPLHAPTRHTRPIFRTGRQHCPVRNILLQSGLRVMSRKVATRSFVERREITTFSLKQN